MAGATHCHQHLRFAEPASSPRQCLTITAPREGGRSRTCSQVRRGTEARITYAPVAAPARPHAGQRLDGLSPLGVARVVPPGSRRVRSQREALRGGLGCPDLAAVRADFRAHLTGWWRIHVNHASWGGEGRPPRGTTEPTRAKVCQLAGRWGPDGEWRPMSVSTFKACRRWWEARGYIAIVRPGWTPDLAPGVLRTPDEHNIRQAYVLCTPRKACPAPGRSPASTLTRPLSQSRRDLDRFPARETLGQGPGKPDKTGAPRSPILCRGPLRELTDGWWAHLTAPFAAWSAADIVWAIDHEPNGRQHRYRLENVRHPVAWLRWRLSQWLDGDGTPLPSRSQQAAEAHRQVRAEQAARRASDAAARAQAADYPAQAARAREMLTRALGRRLGQRAPTQEARSLLLRRPAQQRFHS